MKKTVVVLLALLPLLINGCDAHTFAIITIQNDSPHDLHVDFITKHTRISGSGGYSDQYKEIALLQGETAAFCLEGFGPSIPRNPNKEIMQIICYTMEDHALIKELDVTGNLFRRTSSEKYQARYRLIINGELLQ